MAQGSGVFHIKMIMWGVFNISINHKSISFNSMLKYLQSKVAFGFQTVECRPLLDCVRSLDINGHSPLNTKSQDQRYRQILSLKSPDTVWYLRKLLKQSRVIKKKFYTF